MNYEDHIETTDKNGNDITVFFHFEYKNKGLSCTYYYAVDDTYSAHVSQERYNKTDIEAEIEEWLDDKWDSSRDFFEEEEREYDDALRAEIARDDMRLEKIGE